MSGRLQKFSVLSEAHRSVEPAQDPVTFSDIKAWNLLGHTNDDAIFTALIKPAVSVLETFTERAFITQTRIAYYSSYGLKVRLPYPPILGVTTVEQVTQDDTTLLVLDSDYFIKGVKDQWLELPSFRNRAPGHSLDDNISDFNLKVTYTCGYGANPSDVPQGIRDAIVRTVHTWYEMKEDISDMSVNKVPYDAKMLAAPFRRPTINTW